MRNGNINTGVNITNVTKLSANEEVLKNVAEKIAVTMNDSEAIVAIPVVAKGETFNLKRILTAPFVIIMNYVFAVFAGLYDMVKATTATNTVGYWLNTFGFTNLDTIITPRAFYARLLTALGISQSDLRTYIIDRIETGVADLYPNLGWESDMSMRTLLGRLNIDENNVVTTGTFFHTIIGGHVPGLNLLAIYHTLTTGYDRLVTDATDAKNNAWLNGLINTAYCFVVARPYKINGTIIPCDGVLYVWNAYLNAFVPTAVVTAIDMNLWLTIRIHKGEFITVIKDEILTAGNVAAEIVGLNGCTLCNVTWKGNFENLLALITKIANVQENKEALEIIKAITDSINDTDRDMAFNTLVKLGYKGINDIVTTGTTGMLINDVIAAAEKATMEPVNTGVDA